VVESHAHIDGYASHQVRFGGFQGDGGHDFQGRKEEPADGAGQAKQGQLAGLLLGMVGQLVRGRILLSLLTGGRSRYIMS
jgi:hypothetical protein